MAVTPAGRSRIMKAIRSKNTRPERRVRSWLHLRGFRFRIHDRRLPGAPDIVLPRYHAVVEVRGCFWHQHPKCRNAAFPRSNVGYWRTKLTRTKRRDRQNERELRRLGWAVFVIWECEISDRALEKTLSDLRQLILAVS